MYYPKVGIRDGFKKNLVGSYTLSYKSNWDCLESIDTPMCKMNTMRHFDMSWRQKWYLGVTKKKLYWSQFTPPETKNESMTSRCSVILMRSYFIEGHRQPNEYYVFLPNEKSASVVAVLFAISFDMGWHYTHSWCDCIRHAVVRRYWKE